MLFIFVCLVGILFGVSTGKISSLENYSHLPNIETLAKGHISLAQTSHPPLIDGIDATADVNRSVTIRLNARVVIEDEIEIKINDNKTSLALINYSIPSSFQKSVERVDFFVKYTSFLSIIQLNNSRTYETFVGLEATTYFVDVKNGSLPITGDKSSRIFILARFYAFNHIIFTLNGNSQRGTFLAPLRAHITNINTSTFVYTQFDGSTDIISSDSSNSAVLSENRIIYSSLLSTGYNPNEGIKEDLDYFIIVFDSVANPDSSATSTIPYSYKNIQRTVKIDPYGWVYVTEIVTLTHHGAPRPQNAPSFVHSHAIRNTLLSVPVEATITAVFDEYGGLNHDARNQTNNYPLSSLTLDNGYEAVEISFRNPIYGGEDYSFTFNYRFSSESEIFVEDGMLRLDTSLFSRYNGTVANLDVTYQLPVGASFVGHSLNQSTFSSIILYEVTTKRASFFNPFSRVEFNVKGTNVTELDNIEFKIYYSYQPLWALSPIIWYTLIFASFFGIYTVWRIKRKSVEETIEASLEKIPLRELENFYTAFINYRKVVQTLDKLRNARKRKKIKKALFVAQKRKIEKNLDNMGSELEVAFKAAQKAPQKYKNLVENVMLSFRKHRDTKSLIRDVESQYRRKKVNKEMYFRLSSEYTGQLKSLENRVERGIQELVEITS